MADKAAGSAGPGPMTPLHATGWTCLWAHAAIEAAGGGGGGGRRCAKRCIKKINLAAVVAACGWRGELERQRPIRGDCRGPGRRPESRLGRE